MSDPESNLRELWTSQGVPEARQAEILAAIDERATVNPFAEACRYYEQLESERLSAEFRSPLTRENVRHRLKCGRGPVQLSILEPAPEPDKQGELF